MHGDTHAGILIPFVAAPLVNTIFIVYTGADLCASDTLRTAAARFERIIERAWAIVFIDASITLVQLVAFGGMVQNDAGSRIMGVAVLFLQTMLLYAEPFAALDDETGALALIPLAVLRSMMLAWVNMRRICAMFVLQLAVIALPDFVQLWMPHAQSALFYVDIAYSTLATAILSAIFTVAYFDTLEQEPESAV